MNGYEIDKGIKGLAIASDAERRLNHYEVKTSRY